MGGEARSPTGCSGTAGDGGAGEPAAGPLPGQVADLALGIGPGVILEIDRMAAWLRPISAEPCDADDRLLPLQFDTLR
jgi:hypothetical protein